MTKAFACPYFGNGAEALNGQVTMRDAHNRIKTLACVKWENGDCDLCDDGGPNAKSEFGDEPREFHE